MSFPVSVAALLLWSNVSISGILPCNAIFLSILLPSTRTGGLADKLPCVEHDLQASQREWMAFGAVSLLRHCHRCWRCCFCTSLPISPPFFMFLNHERTASSTVAHGCLIFITSGQAVSYVDVFRLRFATGGGGCQRWNNSGTEYKYQKCERRATLKRLKTRPGRLFDPLLPRVLFFQERVVCGLKLQGLFLKRQTEVSAHFAEITANEILTSHAMWEVSTVLQWTVCFDLCCLSTSFYAPVDAVLYECDTFVHVAFVRRSWLSPLKHKT